MPVPTAVTFFNVMASRYRLLCFYGGLPKVSSLRWVIEFFDAVWFVMNL